LDPTQRLSIEQEIRKKKEREIRYAQHDSKRKRLVEELEQREAAFKKSKEDIVEKRRREQETERIKEEGRKMREQAIAEAEAVMTPSAPESMDRPTENKLDTTVCLRYTLTSHPSLDSVSSLANHLKSNRFSNFDERTMVLKKAAKGKKNKASSNPIMNATALIPFNTVGDAFAIVCAGGNERRGLKGIQITWASGIEPAVVASLKQQAAPREETPMNGSKTFSFSTNNSQTTIPELDFESATLMRLRQAERERLEREIREQEDAEET